MSDAVRCGKDSVPRVFDRIRVEKVGEGPVSTIQEDMERAMKFRARPSKSTWKRGNVETSEASVEIVHGEGEVGVEAEGGGRELSGVAPSAEVAYDDAVWRLRKKDREKGALLVMMTWCRKDVRLKSNKLPSSLWHIPTGD